LLKNLNDVWIAFLNVPDEITLTLAETVVANRTVTIVVRVDPAVFGPQMLVVQLLQEVMPGALEAGKEHDPWQRSFIVFL
jgi:hypothetical protein